MIAALAVAPSGFACDTASCSLVSRGQNGLVAKGELRVDLSFRYTDESVPLEGADSAEPIYRPKVAFEQGILWPQFHEEIDGHEAFLQADLAYGLARGTTLLASLPLIADRSATVAHIGIPADDYGTTGFGDILLGVRQGIPWGLVGGASVKLPNAGYRREGDFDGSILDPTLQPGSGAWAYVASLQRGGRISGAVVDWSIAGSYQLNTTNDLEYRFGDLGLVALSASTPVWGPLSASLQVKFVNEARHEYRGQDVPSTGSRFLYVSPGLKVRLPDRSALYGLVQFLPYRYVNETQLAPSVAVLGGIQKTF
ncbi:MAG TPA: hypothetical protein VFM88_09800 [Vicinamibacteria bacterium]|nr:hypothetical protein [Vicinamibacteria bacterium]